MRRAHGRYMGEGAAGRSRRSCVDAPWMQVEFCRFLDMGSGAVVCPASGMRLCRGPLWNAWERVLIGLACSEAHRPTLVFPFPA